MKGYTYIDNGKFDFTDKAKPELQSPKDAVVRVTLSISVQAIYTSNTVVFRGHVRELQSATKWLVSLKRQALMS